MHSGLARRWSFEAVGCKLTGFVSNGLGWLPAALARPLDMSMDVSKIWGIQSELESENSAVKHAITVRL